MSVDWNSYGQIPANHNSVCQQTGIHTDRFQQISFLYVSCQGFIRTDSNKSHFCMSTDRNSYGQIPTSLNYVCQLSVKLPCCSQIQSRRGKQPSVRASPHSIGQPSHCQEKLAEKIGDKFLRNAYCSLYCTKWFVPKITIKYSHKDLAF